MSAATTATQSSYVERKIDITVQLGQGSYGQSGFDTVKLSGLRVAATIIKYGPPGASRAEIRIYGVQPSIMNQLSTMGVPVPMDRLNIVTVEAGDAVNGMAVVYTGTLQDAWQDNSEMPETFFRIIGLTGTYDAMKPVPPISFPGAADVATIVSGIATRMGRAFENSGVQTKLASPYFPGTAVEQLHSVKRAADIEMYDDGNTIAIWPKTGTRGGAIPLINKDSGLIGYPDFRDNGMAFRCLYNPNILFGGQIQMQSTVGAAATPASAGNPTPPPAPATPAPAPSPPSGDTMLPEVVVHAKAPAPQAGGPNGVWYVNGLSYDLAAQIPGGPWFADVRCARLPGTPAA